MKRIVFATVALLAIAIAAVLVIPRTGRKPDARSILIAAAQAAEEAKSVHIVGRGDAGGRILPGRLDIWVTPRAFYMRYLGTDGTTVSAELVDADAAKWWFYVAPRAVQYVADLRPVVDKVAEGISHMSGELVSGEVLRQAFRDTKESVTTETHGGRKVATLTFTRTTDFPARGAMPDRFVFEVDCQTNRLLTMRRYVKPEGAPEELMEAFDEIEYNVPLPQEIAAVQVPTGTTAVQAVATADGSNKRLVLVMASKGIEIQRRDFPRD